MAWQNKCYVRIKPRISEHRIFPQKIKSLETTVKQGLKGSGSGNVGEYTSWFTVLPGMTLGLKSLIIEHFASLLLITDISSTSKGMKLKDNCSLEEKLRPT